MKKVFKKIFSVGALLALLLGVGTAMAANQFSSMTPILMSKINAGSNYNNSSGWSTTTSGVLPGNTVALQIFLYNPTQTTANDVIVKLTPQGTGVVSSTTFNASIQANGFDTINGTATVSMSTPTSLSFTGINSQGTNAVALWKDLGGTNGTSDATVTYLDGSALFTTGLNIGSLPPDCSGNGGCHQGALVVHFRAPDAQQPNTNCTITSFTANPSYISYGSSTNLSWTSNGCTSTSISGPGVSSFNQNSNGSISTSALYNSATYTITGYGNGGSDSEVTYVTVNNNQQQYCSISAYASPSSVSYGGSSTLYWNSTGANSVYISGLNYNNYYNQSVSGSVTTGAIYGTQTYTFTANCQNGQSQSSTVYVYTNQQQTYQCNDGYDNDGDSRIDMSDPGCTSVYDNDEYNQATLSVITTSASNFTQTSARLNGLLVNSGGYATNGYFQWGTTSALGSSTNSLPIGSSNQQSFFNTIFGLSANTTYYYRAVATNTLGTVYGDIVSFTTSAATVTPPTVINTTTVVSGTGSGSNLIQLEITPSNATIVGFQDTTTTAVTTTPIIANVCVADRVSYRVYYKNISGRTLNDAVLHVELPKDVLFEGTTAGIYNASDNTVTLPVGTLIRNQEGTFFITVTVLRSAVDRDLLVATATITVENPTTLARENAIAYGLVSTSQCAKNGLLGLALFSGFWPTSLLGWLLLLLLVLLVIYLASRFYRERRVVGRPAPHYEDMDIPTYRSSGH